MRVECPVCGFGLRGSDGEGYRCVQCHARYGHGFVRNLRRREFSALIHEHFATDRATEEVTILPAEESIIEIEELVRDSPGRLEDFVADASIPSEESSLQSTPIRELMQKRRDRYDPTARRP